MVRRVSRITPGTIRRMEEDGRNNPDEAEEITSSELSEACVKGSRKYGKSLARFITEKRGR
jgi:hypothetical protein